MKEKRAVPERSNLRLALAPFLDLCPEVVTLGVRPCLDDYSEQEVEWLRNAYRVFFPTRKYVDILHACQIPTFPCATTYRYQRSRLLQQLLFSYSDCPHPHSRIYYGQRQKERILDHFKLPVLVMGTLNVPDTIHLIRHAAELDRIINLQHSVIVRELVQFSERIQLVCVQFEPIGALRLLEGQPSSITEPVSLDHASLTKPLAVTKQLLQAARLDDVLIEWGNAGGSWQVIGMTRPPLKWPTPQGTMNRHHYICELIQSGAL
ncbi:MAG: hypothetical protein RBS57_12180 [Desulforhabdus sp.]|nr:hypothetical protein [Desulforhabdus sp.]